jgi:hypothetical protein
VLGDDLSNPAGHDRGIVGFDHRKRAGSDPKSIRDRDAGPASTVIDGYNARHL